MRISQSEHARRRRALMALMEPGSIAIVTGADICHRNRGVEYPFRQESDFQYLTGVPESGAVMALIPERVHGEYILFCQEEDPTKALWLGPRIGQEQAVAFYGADDAFPVEDIDDILPGLIEGKERVYYVMGNHDAFDHRLMDWVAAIRSQSHQGALPPKEFMALDYLLHEMRLYKTAAEVRLMRRAADISAEAHRAAMHACRPGGFEYQLEAELEYVFRHRGARFSAYNSIVAAGSNACILHYQDNSARLKKGDLVMIDAGCEVDCYASDISRTFPVSGQFSPEQRALYEVVLAANKAAIDCVRPGRSWNDAHEASVQVMTEGLVRLGLLSGTVEELIVNEAYGEFYMHRIGHWLGMDVHDVGEYRVDGEWRMLEPGMTVTIEPGLYIQPDNLRVARKWRGIGIRVEDDVVVTRNGNEVLTAAAPKEIAEIEDWMAQGA